MSVKEIVEATGGRVLSGPDNISFPRLFTDSREVEPGGLFVALRGEQHDGHVFIPQAMERGAGGILCERPPPGSDGAAVIVVDDTRQALLDMTSERLRRRPLPIVAVTGSAGKTTTKELIAHLLGRRQRVHKSEGNLNTYTGIPMTIFQMDPRDRVLVVEYAMSRAGRGLPPVARPPQRLERPGGGRCRPRVRVRRARHRLRSARLYPTSAPNEYRDWTQRCDGHRRLVQRQPGLDAGRTGGASSGSQGIVAGGGVG